MRSALISLERTSTERSSPTGPEGELSGSQRMVRNDLRTSSFCRASCAAMMPVIQTERYLNVSSVK